MAAEPLPEFFGAPADGPAIGSAPTLAGAPACWSAALRATIKAFRTKIDAGDFSDEKVAARIATFRSDPAQTTKYFVEARAALELFAEKTDGWGCIHQPAEVGGIAGQWTSWPNSAGPPILWVHGGAFTLYSSNSYRAFAARLSGATGRPVFVCDYRRSPEHPHPAALQDVASCWRALAVPGAAIGGDSAGGALVLMYMLQDTSTIPPARAVLIAPWLDTSCATASAAANERADYVTAGSLRLSGVVNGGPNPLTEPGKLANLPPLLVMVGSCDVLLDDSLALARSVADAGGNVRLSVAAAMPHAYTAFAAIEPRAQKGIADAAEFFKGA